jgi:hypothetical protein
MNHIRYTSSARCVNHTATPSCRHSGHSRLSKRPASASLARRSSSGILGSFCGSAVFHQALSFASQPSLPGLPWPLHITRHLSARQVNLEPNAIESALGVPGYSQTPLPGLKQRLLHSHRDASQRSAFRSSCSVPLCLRLPSQRSKSRPRSPWSTCRACRPRRSA